MNFYSAVALLTGAAFWPVLIVVIKFAFIYSLGFLIKAHTRFDENLPVDMR